MNDVTEVLSAIEKGDPRATEQLLPLVYQELRQMAARKLSNEDPGQTLQATALVHEAYLRLIEKDGIPSWRSRAHFFGAAAVAMRRVLIDVARRRRALKRGGTRLRLRLDDLADQVAAPEGQDIDFVALDEALSDLERVDPAKAKLVELRYFAGLTIDEAAQALDVSPATAKRSWVFARAWLYRRLHE